jgi:serine/threonine protein kinase
MPLEGQQLGHYHLLRLLGSGGMGEVYLAEDARIGQQVAIKVIRSEGIAYPQSESAQEAARLFERRVSSSGKPEPSPGWIIPPSFPCMPMGRRRSTTLC